MEVQKLLNLSKDYEKLYATLIELGDVPGCYGIPCFVDHKYKISDKDYVLRDISCARYWPDEPRISVGVRGIGHIETYHKDTKDIKTQFIEQCKYYDLEWVDTTIKAEALVCEHSFVSSVAYKGARICSKCGVLK
ncbi:MAG: hypothetical protein V4547_18320 [Bacteroidota bacterium]